MVTFEPELRCNISNDNNLGNEINEIMNNKLQNKAEKQDHEPDTFDEIHTNEKDATMVSNEYVEAKNPICSYEDDIPQNAKDIRKTYPRDNKCKDVMQNKVKNKEANESIIKVLGGCMSKPLKDVKEDDANIHTEHVSLKSKGSAIAIKDNSISPMANFSKTNGFQMMSISNIMIISTLFGVILVKDLGGVRENELVRDTSKREPTITGNKDGRSMISYENTLISAFDCLDSALPSTRISLNPPKQCNIEDGSAYERPERRKAQVLEHVRLLPVEITTCVVQFRVNVGWRGVSLQLKLTCIKTWRH